MNNKIIVWGKGFYEACKYCNGYGEELNPNRIPAGAQV